MSEHKEETTMRDVSVGIYGNTGDAEFEQKILDIKAF
jgi:hypothetical protein